MTSTQSKSKFALKRDFGVGEIIAIGALLVSVIALRQSCIAAKPHVLISSGRVGITIVESETEGTCALVARIPIEVSNSGARAVRFERIVEVGGLPPVVFLNRPDRAVAGEHGPPYELYLAEKDYTQEGGWHTALAAEPIFDPAEAKFQTVIVGPGEKLNRFLYIRTEIYERGTRQADSIALALDLEFSESSTQELRLGFEVPPIERTSCKPVS